ncbi:MAG: cache domain-containing protein, partial [Spirochaetaceae bacterium]|nr:cache domain-containing protein [Spirochaetaceae bacterium]
MKKIRLSLASQILMLCLSLILVISITLSVIFITNINRMTEEDLRALSRETMLYLNADIQNALAPAIQMTRLAASFANAAAEDPELLDAVMAGMLATDDSVFEMYYGTVRSRFEGGFFITATDWNPYGDNPEWDQVKRPWFTTAMEHPGELVVTAPYEDSQTGKICVTTVHTVQNLRGEIAGVVGADVFLDVLTRIVTARSITADGNTILIDGDGLYVVHNDPSLVMTGNFFDDAAKQMPVNRKEMLSGAITVNFSGDTYICSAPVSGTGL